MWPTPFRQVVVEAWLRQHAMTMRAIADEVPHLELPPGRKAAVLDIDEVLLCNVAPRPMMRHDGTETEVAELFNGTYGGLAKWFATDKSCPPLPGAVALLETLRAAGITVFLVTGREEKYREATLRNFEDAGMLSLLAIHAPATTTRSTSAGLLAPDEHCAERWHEVSDRLFMVQPGSDAAGVAAFKRAARGAIKCLGYTIALCVGDQLSDLGEPGAREWLLGHGMYRTD